MPERRKTTEIEAAKAAIGSEAKLWRRAGRWHGAMDAAKYKHGVLGLIFLKSISHAFEEQHTTLEVERAEGADPEDPDEYRAVNVFWPPAQARWAYLKTQACPCIACRQARQPTIGRLVDDAMAGIERDNFSAPRAEKSEFGLYDAMALHRTRQPGLLLTGTGKRAWRQELVRRMP